VHLDSHVTAQVLITGSAAQISLLHPVAKHLVGLIGTHPPWPLLKSGSHWSPGLHRIREQESDLVQQTPNFVDPPAIHSDPKGHLMLLEPFPQNIVFPVLSNMGFPCGHMGCGVFLIGLGFFGEQQTLNVLDPLAAIGMHLPPNGQVRPGPHLKICPVFGSLMGSPDGQMERGLPIGFFVGLGPTSLQQTANLSAGSMMHLDPFGQPTPPFPQNNSFPFFLRGLPNGHLGGVIPIGFLIGFLVGREVGLGLFVEQQTLNVFDPLAAIGMHLAPNGHVLPGPQVAVFPVIGSLTGLPSGQMEGGLRIGFLVGLGKVLIGFFVGREVGLGLFVEQQTLNVFDPLAAIRIHLAPNGHVLPEPQVTAFPVIGSLM